MKYENKVIVFPISANLNVGTTHHVIEGCKLSMHNRRYTLKIGNAIRLRKLDKSTEFINCRIFFEGSLCGGRIIPFAKYKSFIAHQL